MKINYLLKISAVVIMLFSINLQMLAGIGVGTSEGGALPVELTIFSASTTTNGILLNWQTATEVNNYGFEIERASSPLSTHSNEVTQEWEKVGFVEGHGNSNSPKDYSFIDTNPQNGDGSYRLKQIDINGKFTYSSVIEIKNNLAKEYTLEQNYPNPFNPSTTISYSIPNESNVTIKVFDVLGNELITLVNQKQSSGVYQRNFNASDLSSGVYFYRIQANSLNNSTQYFETKKMSILK